MTFATLADALAWRGLNQPTLRAFTFLREGEVERPVHLTYGELDERARQAASFIQASVSPVDQPVLLLFPPGIDIIAALFGCFYSGAIAVIADWPRRPVSVSAVESILEDCGATVGITMSLADVEPYCNRSPKLRRLRWLAMNEILGSGAPDRAFRLPVSSDSIALLQYTSGSTGTPKGVMVSHGNIAFNSAAIQQRFLQSESSRTVVWVPPSHDMGLVGGILQPLYTGYPGTLMPPLAFVQRPARWLQAISRLRATTSTAPNFAYDLCVRKISLEQRAGLDLSAWTVAINGAEPVQPATIERFSEYFAPCGFRREAFCPSYGLAEATLVVSGGKREAPPKIAQISRASSGVESPALVGCGGPVHNGELVIVDPELGVPSRPGQVGEIWLCGPSVAKGYWKQMDETQAAFGAYLASTGQGPFLRTGDLGCLVEGELFITGRSKELIIVRGVNYAPQAIEQTVEKCHPALRSAAGAALMVRDDVSEHLVVLHELERAFVRTVPETEVFHAIREAVGEEHGLEVEGIVLLRTGSLPRTLTGKTNRQGCREGYLNGSLNAVAQWSLHSVGRGLETAAELPDTALPDAPSAERAFREWLLQKLAAKLKVSVADIDPRRPFAEYGFDSAAIVELAGDLEDYLECELSPTLVYDYPTVDALCRHLTANPLAKAAGQSH